MAKEYNINVDPRILELLGPNLYTLNSATLL